MKWGRNRFRKIRYSNDNSNENDESEINEKDEETGTLDDPMTNETKEVIIDWFMILKAIKWLLSNITEENFCHGKVMKYFPGDE